FGNLDDGVASVAGVYGTAERRRENLAIADDEDGKVLTPPLSSSVLPGIPRELLYIADEVFFTGTAAEVTPIRSVDRIQIGSGRRGPITERIQKEFFS